MPPSLGESNRLLRLPNNFPGLLFELAPTSPVCHAKWSSLAINRQAPSTLSVLPCFAIPKIQNDRAVFFRFILRLFNFSTSFLMLIFKNVKRNSWAIILELWKNGFSESRNDRWNYGIKFLEVRKIAVEFLRVHNALLFSVKEFKYCFTAKKMNESLIGN